MILPKGGMNMIDMEQEVEIKWYKNTKKYYIDKGYVFTKLGDIFKVKVKDLLESSGLYVKVTCDYCGKEYMKKYRKYIESHNNCLIQKDSCYDCKKFKIIDVFDNSVSKRSEKPFNIVRQVMDERGYKLITKQEEYTGMDMKIKYICPIHGEISQNIQTIVYQHAGCRKCADIEVGNNFRNDIDKVSEIISSVDGNILLNPDDYISTDTRNLWIQCSCGSKFYASLTSYLNGKNRCSKCCETESAGEKRIRQWLDENNIKYIQEYCYKDCKDIKPLPFDFYLLHGKGCIEFDGKQHFYPYFGEEAFQKTVLHDNIKNQYCIDHNIKLIRIPYTQYRNIDKILTKELLTI